MYKTVLKIFIPSLICCWACQNSITPSADPAVYQNEIAKWQDQRLAELKAADGWTTLAGLFKLKAGENTFGSKLENEVVFPEKAPEKMGSIYVAMDSVYTKIANGVDVYIKDSLINEAPLSAQNPEILEHGSLKWHLIERGGQFFVRLRDTLHPARYELTEIPHFPIDPKWQIRAKFIPFDPPETIPVRNVLDMDIDQHCEGKLQFTINDQTHEIWVLDGGPDEFFLIIADLTTGEETYGGGRYLYVPRPDQEGYTNIDFNKAHNPPCVFTKYATCLLPPMQNRLDVRIEAGEIMFDFGEGH